LLIVPPSAPVPTLSARSVSRRLDSPGPIEARTRKGTDRAGSGGAPPASPRALTRSSRSPAGRPNRPKPDDDTRALLASAPAAQASGGRSPSYSAMFRVSWPFESTRQVAGGNLSVWGSTWSLTRAQQTPDLLGHRWLTLQSAEPNQALELSRGHRRIRPRRPASGPRPWPRTSPCGLASRATGRPSSRSG
jgi:hypothetical protein